MNGFEIGKVYIEHERKLVQIRPLPGKYCSFDCVFCPLEKNVIKTDQGMVFPEMKEFLARVSEFLATNSVDMVFVNPCGEALVNSELGELIKVIKEKGVAVRLLSNGYIINYAEFKDLLGACDEIISELAVVNEADFQKLQRPIKGFTLDKYVGNMADFNGWYKGVFILDITILKNHSDSDAALDKLEEIINKIDPSYVYFQTSSDEKFKKAFQISDERLLEIENRFRDIIGVLGQ